MLVSPKSVVSHNNNYVFACSLLSTSIKVYVHIWVRAVLFVLLEFSGVPSSLEEIYYHLIHMETTNHPSWLKKIKNDNILVNC